MNGDADASLPASSLLEIERLEPAGAGEADVARWRSDACTKSAWRRQRRAAQRVHREQHLIVLEVGRLQPRFDAVGEPHDGDADVGELAARFDARRLRLLFDERPRRRGIAPRRDGHFVGRARAPRAGRLRSAARRLGFSRLHGEHDAALARQARARQRRHFLERDAGQHAAAPAGTRTRCRGRLAFEEVAGRIRRAYAAALALVALVVGPLVERGHPALVAIELGLVEAVLAHAARFDLERVERRRAGCRPARAPAARRSRTVGVSGPPPPPAPRNFASGLRASSPNRSLSMSREQLLDEVAAVVADRGRCRSAGASRTSCTRRLVSSGSVATLTSSSVVQRHLRIRRRRGRGARRDRAERRSGSLLRPVPRRCRRPRRSPSVRGDTTCRRTRAAARPARSAGSPACRSAGAPRSASRRT